MLQQKGDLYSASEDGLVNVVCCFFTHHEMRYDPRKKQKPWWEKERKVASVVVASPMESKVRPENF